MQLGTEITKSRFGTTVLVKRLLKMKKNKKHIGLNMASSFECPSNNKHIDEI
jgi:hypothetical protein